MWCRLQKARVGESPKLFGTHQLAEARSYKHKQIQIKFKNLQCCWQHVLNSQRLVGLLIKLQAHKSTPSAATLQGGRYIWWHQISTPGLQGFNPKKKGILSQDKWWKKWCCACVWEPWTSCLIHRRFAQNVACRQEQRLGHHGHDDVRETARFRYVSP